MAPLDPFRLLRWGYWFEGSAGPPTPYTFVVAAFFVAALVLTLLLWQRRRSLFPGDRIKTRLAARLGPWGVGIAATGSASALLRSAEFPILSARAIWLVCFLALAGIGGYVAWYLRRRYPAERALLDREEAKRRFMPRPRARRTARRRR